MGAKAIKLGSWFVFIPNIIIMNIMSFKLKIIGKITWGLSLEALFNQFNNVVFSSSRKGVPTKTCNHMFGGQMGSIQGYSTTSSL